MQAPWPGKCFLILQYWHNSRLLFTGRLDGGGTRVASTASSVEHVGAVGEPTCHGRGARGGDVGAVGEPTPTSDVGHVTSGRDMGAEGEPTPTPEGGHVGAVGKPTCHGGGGRGGDVGPEGEPTSPSEGEHVGAEGEPTWQGEGGRGGGSGAGESSRPAPSS